MPVNDDALRNLARQLDGTDGPASPSREKLEATLLPMVRCALRTGQGQPTLVQWVRRNLAAVTALAPAGRGAELEWTAPTMTRLLCHRLLRQKRPALAAAGDTLVDR